MRVGVARLERDRLVAAGQGFVVSLRRAQHVGQVGVGLGGSRVDRDGALDAAHRSPRIAGLEFGNTEQMLGIEVIGVSAQDLAVRRLGFGKVAHLPSGMRPLEQCLRVAAVARLPHLRTARSRVPPLSSALRARAGAPRNRRRHRLARERREVSQRTQPRSCR